MKLRFCSEKFNAYGDYKPENELLKSILYFQLQAIVEKYYSPDGCENPDILGEWDVIDDPVYDRLLLFRDGGDWAEEDEDGHERNIGAIFVRKKKESEEWEVYLPNQEAQDFLIPIVNQVANQAMAGNTDGIVWTVTGVILSYWEEDEKWISLNDPRFQRIFSGIEEEKE